MSILNDDVNLQLVNGSWFQLKPMNHSRATLLGIKNHFHTTLRMSTHWAPVVLVLDFIDGCLKLMLFFALPHNSYHTGLAFGRQTNTALIGG